MSCVRISPSVRALGASDVKVVSAQSVIWPNGALGCAKPGEMFTQATRARLSRGAGGRREALSPITPRTVGYFRLCENESNSGLDRGSIK